MASRRPHLEVVEGREVVFCYNCRHEWYRDVHPSSLTCPICRSGCAEIVTFEHDPRVDDGTADSDSDQSHLHHYLQRHLRHQDDHLHHLDTSLHNLNTHRQNLQTNRQRFDAQRRHHGSDSDPEEGDIEEHLFRGPGRLAGHRLIHRSPESSPYSHRTRVRSGSSSDMFRRLTELMGDTGGRGMVGRSGPETLFQDDNNGSRVTYQTFHGPGFTGGMSSFTFTTGSAARMPHSPAGSGPRTEPDPFMRMFSELLSNVPPVPTRPADSPSRDPNSESDGDGPERHDITTVLNQLLAVIVNPNIAHGDAVYSQEALDRIITNLMEANPQSNAPPPATENAIASLPKKKLDRELLGPDMKGECTICIEEVHAGDEVSMLPCGHWFHEECARLWLKQHNSCPVCRAPIDGAGAGKQRNEATSSQAAGPSSSSSSTSRPAESGPMQPPQREDRFDHLRGRQQDPNASASHGSSQCPTPPSRSSTNGERNRDNRGSSSSGPLNWLRDRLSGR